MKTKRQATVVTRVGHVEVDAASWGRKTVTYTSEDGSDPVTATTKLPATKRRAIRFAAQLTPDKTDFAAHGEDGSANLYVPVETKDRVEIKHRFTGGSRRSMLLRPEMGTDAKMRSARVGTILTDTIDVEGRKAKLTVAWDEVKTNLRREKGNIVLNRG